MRTFVNDKFYERFKNFSIIWGKQQQNKRWSPQTNDNYNTFLILHIWIF